MTFTAPGADPPRHEDPSPEPSRGLLTANWWTGGKGWAGIAQWPNPALAVWIIASLATHAGPWATAPQKSALTGIGHGALVVWALDELVRGANPFRRLLGAIVLSVQLTRLLT